jgi:hypothetical protein
MRLQTVSAPDAFHRADTDALNLGYGSADPVRRLVGWIRLGRSDHARHSPGYERRDARRARLVAQQARDTIGREAFLPASHSRLADTRVAHDLGRVAAIRRQQQDLCSPDALPRSVSVRHDRIQPDTTRSIHLNFDACVHPVDSHFGDAAGSPNRTQTSEVIHLSLQLAASVLCPALHVARSSGCRRRCEGPQTDQRPESRARPTRRPVRVTRQRARGLCAELLARDILPTTC